VVAEGRIWKPICSLIACQDAEDWTLPPSGAVNKLSGLVVNGAELAFDVIELAAQREAHELRELLLVLNVLIFSLCIFLISNVLIVLEAHALIPDSQC